MDRNFKGDIIMNGRNLNRREFMKLASLGLAGGYLGLKPDLSEAMMHGGGNGVINPTPGDFLVDPVEIISSSGLVEAELGVKVAPININGVTANLLTYNGYFPAPTIRVKKGDVVRLRFINSLPSPTETNILGYTKNITNLHTHGWHVSPAGNSDNVFNHFMPDDRFLLEYDTSRQESGTLSFYHPHVHGTVAEQIWGGLAGALVVEDETDVLAEYETHILILKDIRLQGSEPEPYNSIMDYKNGKEGDIVMVNGQVNPQLPIKPGQVQRWRILNASTARFYKLSFENHTMFLIGTDGGMLDKPYPLSNILLSPGERIDILVKANQTPGTYRLLSLPYNRGGMMMGMGGNTRQTVTLMTVSCDGTFATDEIPVAINPNAKRLNVNTNSLPRRRLVLSMRMGRGLINGQDFAVRPYTITSKVGTQEVWEIVNQSGMDHPFHQHVNPSQILSITGGDRGYASLYATVPAWKDTVIVPKMGGRVTMLVPVNDFTGKTAFHCHIVEHEDIGMMGIWELT
jgi:FtsP/CotA-like multicopper oxidase with cupredoxin domain